MHYNYLMKESAAHGGHSAYNHVRNNNIDAMREEGLTEYEIHQWRRMSNIISEFETYGRQVYKLNHKIIDMLINTSLNGIPSLNDINLPYPCFYVDIPYTPSLNMVGDGTQLTLRGMYILPHTEGELGEDRAIHIVLHLPRVSQQNVYFGSAAVHVLIPRDYRSLFEKRIVAYRTKDIEQESLLKPYAPNFEVGLAVMTAQYTLGTELVSAGMDPDDAQRISVHVTDEGEYMYFIGEDEYAPAQSIKDRVSEMVKLKTVAARIAVHFLVYMNTDAVEKKLAQIPTREALYREQQLATQLSELDATLEPGHSSRKRERLAKMHAATVTKTITITKIAMSLDGAAVPVSSHQGTGGGASKAGHWRRGSYVFRRVGPRNDSRLVIRWVRPVHVNEDSPNQVERSHYDVQTTDGVWSWEDPHLPEGTIDTFVYFVQNTKNQAIKIGYTMDPHKELERLGRSSDDELVLLGWFTGTQKDAVILHELFTEHRVSGGTEWFDYNPDLQDFMDDLIEYKEDE